MKPTHIIRYNDTVKANWLFRASDGMLIGVCEKITVIFGEDPNKRVSRLFMEHEQAIRYLREKVAIDDFKAIPQCSEDGSELAFHIEYRNEEQHIIQPGTVVMPGSGSIHKLN